MEPTITTLTPEPITDWAIIEIMGHEKLAGQVSETTVAGVQMLRVQVPSTDSLPGFERLLSGASIFSLTPVAESVARIMVGSLQKTAVSLYIGGLGQQQQIRKALGLPEPQPRTDRMYDDDDDDEPNPFPGFDSDH